MQKNGKFKNLKVDTNLAEDSERLERLDNSALDSVNTTKTCRESPLKKTPVVQAKEIKDMSKVKEDKRLTIPNTDRNTDWVC